MALINCPECGVIVSDKAFQCPKCAYPINSNLSTKQAPTSVELENKVKDNVTVNVQQSDITLSNMLLLADRKSEGTAVLLVLLFGPFGLFYASSDKAVRLIIFFVVATIIAVLITNGNVESYFGLFGVIAILFWIISLVQVGDAVKEYNNSLIENQFMQTKDNADNVDTLRLLIRDEKKLPFYAPSKKDKIISMLDSICIDEQTTEKLVDEYLSRYKRDIITDLKKLTTEKQAIKEYLNPFINFGIIDRQSTDNDN